MPRICCGPIANGKRIWSSLSWKNDEPRDVITPITRNGIPPAFACEEFLTFITWPSGSTFVPPNNSVATVDYSVATPDYFVCVEETERLNDKTERFIVNKKLFIYNIEQTWSFLYLFMTRKQFINHFLPHFKKYSDLFI